MNSRAPLAAGTGGTPRSTARAPSADRWRGFAAVLFGATVLGLSAIFVRFAVQGGATPITVGFYRMVFALPGVLVLAARHGGIVTRSTDGDRSAGDTARARRYVLLAGVAFAADLGLWHSAMGYTTAANATLLVGLAPVWVAIASVMLVGARYDRWAWLGQVVSLGGGAILALARGARGGTGRGEALAFLASFCYAGFTLSLKRGRRTLTAEQALLWMSVSSLIVFAVVLVVRSEPLTGFDGRAWLCLVGLGMIVQVVGWWANTWGIGHTEAALGAIALQAQQVATLFFAAWFLGEPLRPLACLGGALIVAGIVLVARNSVPGLRRKGPP